MSQLLTGVAAHGPGGGLLRHAAERVQAVGNLLALEFASFREVDVSRGTTCQEALPHS